MRAGLLQRLPARLDELELAVAEASQGGPEAVQHLRLLVHRIRGVAGSYGMPALSALAADWEDELARQDVSTAADRVAELRGMVRRLRSAP